jgi:hypothetical protein
MLQVQMELSEQADDSRVLGYAWYSVQRHLTCCKPDML